MSNFNYYDYLKNNQATNSWLGEMNKSFTQLNAPLVKVFKLDMENTNFDTVYNEESSARSYLEPFDIRAIFKVNIWKSLVGLEGPSQSEDNLNLSVNFGDMVNIIRGLKTAHFCELKISYLGSGYAAIYNLNGFLVLKENGIVKLNIDLSVYDTVDKVMTQITGLFSSEKIGKNDLSANLVSFNEVAFFGSTLVIYSPDNTFKNMTDAIQTGDVVMTQENRVYEIKQAYPAGNMGWDYHTYMLICELADMDKIVLPEPYNSKIWKMA